MDKIDREDGSLTASLAHPRRLSSGKSRNSNVLSGNSSSDEESGLPLRVSVFFTLQQLQSGEVEASIEPKRREYYMSDEDFKVHMQSTKAEFAKMPKWKQVNKKKALRLF